jgi:hypothetical protein
VLANNIDAPIPKVHLKLLPTVDDRIGQDAELVFIPALRSQRRVVVLACCRERIERHTANLPIIPDIHLVAGVKIVVMRLSGAFRAICLAPKLCDLRLRLRGCEGM